MSLEKLYVCVRPGWKLETLSLFLYYKIVDCVIDRMDKTMFSINAKRIRGRQFGEGFSGEGLRRKSP